MTLLAAVPSTSYEPATPFSWEVATTVIAGDGALDTAAPLVAARWPRLLVVTDPAPPCRAIAQRLVDGIASAGGRVELRSVPPRATLDAARALASTLSASPAGVVAVGGGSVLDVAKVAAAGARNADLLDGSLWVGPGAIVLRGGGRPSLPCIAVPTTVGTGTEVSTVAVLDASGAGTPKLLVDPSLRPSVAVLDPTQVAALPRPALLTGALEVVLRAIGPMLGTPASHSPGDGLALALASSARHAGDRIAAAPGGVDHRGDASTLAMAGAQTHVAWTAAGRDPYAHRLWYLAHTVVQHAGIPKMRATAALLPAYLRRLHAGDLPAHPDLLAVLDAAGFGLDGTALLRRWRLPASLTEAGVDIDPARLAAGAAEAFGSGALAGVPVQTLERVYRHALAPLTTDATPERR